MGRLLQQVVGAGSKPFSGPLPTCPAHGLFACLHGLRRLASFSPALLGAAPIASFLLALLGAAPLAEASAAKAPCPPATVVDWIETVTEDGEPVLRSSGPVRLMGLRLPDEAPSRTAALTWLRGRQGREVLVQGAPARDRWGRLPARLVLAGQAERLDVAHGLVESGLALVDTATGEGACTPETLALEATARDRGLGLWAEDRYKPVPVGDVTRLRERIGQFTLVEGRIRSVGERRQQTYFRNGLGDRLHHRPAEAGLDSSAGAGSRPGGSRRAPHSGARHSGGAPGSGPHDFRPRGGRGARRAHEAVMTATGTRAIG